MAHQRQAAFMANSDECAPDSSNKSILYCHHYQSFILATVPIVNLLQLPA